ncbi:hypothetical protein BD779DRAFT_1469816 [Infundibulicybe gibba]|nr:hypothetical protein BD779DRAFT_1469816 [Infundibulicybe gibba]
MPTLPHRAHPPTATYECPCPPRPWCIPNSIPPSLPTARLSDHAKFTPTLRPRSWMGDNARRVVDTTLHVRTTKPRGGESMLWSNPTRTAYVYKSRVHERRPPSKALSPWAAVAATHVNPSGRIRACGVQGQCTRRAMGDPTQQPNIAGETVASTRKWTHRALRQGPQYEPEPHIIEAIDDRWECLTRAGA